MADAYLLDLFQVVALYSFGMFNWFLYLALSFRDKARFLHNEQSKLQYAIARDQFWNLSKSPFLNFSHCFYTLRDGLKLHYITNRAAAQSDGPSKNNLVIFIHGFPDSSMEWRHLLQTDAGRSIQKAIVVCVDLPGYGGSDSVQQYGPDTVLEALTEFIVAMREMYLEDGGQSMTNSTHQDECKTYIVGHDWGCVIAYRLAADAPCLADRFILMNGPHVELALANKDRILNSSLKIFKQFKQSPKTNRACLSKSFNALKPLLWQALLFGYIAVFRLPPFMVKVLGTGREFAFLRGAHKVQYGKHKAEYNSAESMACTMGPSPEECSTKTSGAKPESYGATVLTRAKDPGASFMALTAVYRDGLADSPWTKSLEAITNLHHIESNNANGSPLRRRSSSNSSGLFAEHYKGILRAPATVFWGQKDQACTQTICLDGIGDYLSRDSEVILLPRTGHWTPVEKESREAVAKAIEWFVIEGHVVGSVASIVKEKYEGATVFVKK